MSRTLPLRARRVNDKRVDEDGERQKFSPRILLTYAIESSFAAVRLRTRVTQRPGSKKAALAMAYKLLESALERWRRFNGHELVADVLAGVKFTEGIKVTEDDTETQDEPGAA